MPARRSANQIHLGVNDVFRKTQGRNIEYGLGVHLKGLELNAQTGYSVITKLVWEGVRSGCDNWLLGENIDPVSAIVVNASSNCAG